MRDDARDKKKDAPDAGQGGGGAEMREEVEAINTAERGKLEKALSATLSAEQSKQAMTTLGTFNRGWDHMVSTLAGFHLEAGKQTDAAKAVYEFVGEQGKLRDTRGDGDPEARRAAMQAAREKMNTTLKGILSEEQYKQFEATTGRGPRAGGRTDAPGKPDHPGQGKPDHPGGKPADKPKDDKK
jgi:hypothetical protein